FKKRAKFFDTRVCITAQHREMLDQVLDFFEIIPDYDLNLMKPNQDLYSLTSNIIKYLKPVLEEFAPDYVYVHGDTTTTMATSIAAFYSGANICHVEAGLRTHNLLSPFPEEVNRSVTGVVANWHFAPTKASKLNLLKENKKAESIFITDNTVIDALMFSVNKVGKSGYTDVEITRLKEFYDAKKKLILVTGHRRENHGE